MQAFEYAIQQRCKEAFGAVGKSWGDNGCCSRWVADLISLMKE